MSLILTREAMETIGERIRAARIAANLTQEGLAERLDIGRVSVTQWEAEDTKPASSRYSKLAEVLGGTANWYIDGSGTSPLPADTEIVAPGEPTRRASNARISDLPRGVGTIIPVYGQAVGGDDGEFALNGNHLFDVMAPPKLQASEGAYGVTVCGESMYPRYEDGELVYVDPTRTPRRNSYVVAQIRAADGEPPLAYIKRFVRHTTVELVLEQINPEKTLRFPHEQVVSVHQIVLGGER